jgi:Flp pilus assembly protein TadD
MLLPPDIHYLRAASGWFDLGNISEAEAEMANLSDGARGHPDALEMRWLLDARKDDWTGALETAERIVQLAPERSSGWLHRAYALRRAPGGSVARAREALLEASDKFPSESVIPYNLACYACQLGNLDEARKWLRKARSSGGKEAIRQMAVEDKDLEPLWPEIRKW